MRLALVVLALVVGCTYSDGERTGVVTKLSRKGWLCKTWEGEMQMLGYASETAALPGRTWTFSVRDDQVADAIEDAARTGKAVTLHYAQYWPRHPCRQGTEYNVTRVERGQ